MNIAENLAKKYHKVEEVTNFKDMIYRSAEIYASRTAFKLKDKNKNIFNVTYAEFKKDIVALGTSLIEHGLLNKRICVIGKNSYEWAVSYLAATIVGVVVPIDKELHTHDVINFMNVSEASAILGDGKNLNLIIENSENLNNKNTYFIYFNEFKKNANSILFDDIKNNGQELVDNGNKQFDEIEINPDEMRILLFTSGTTGKAKGVCLSQRNICSNILSIYGIVKVRRNDLFFSVLPLHHTYECTIGFLLPIYSGASIAYCEGLKYILKNMNEYHPSVILCVPLLLENMHKNIIKNLNKSLPDKYKSKDKNANPYNNLPFYMKPFVKSKIKNSLGGRLRVFIVGAAPINPIIADDFDALGLNSLQGYGLTECSPLVAGNTDFYKRNDSAGLPIPNVAYKIDNPNDEGVGEIIVQGPNVMLGYYKDDDATNKTIIDGWFHTGDLGKIDENGYLYITGRCKSVIVTKNGKNIYPEELEYYLNDSPLISEALVLGIHKDNDDETYINAQIFPNMEAIKESFKGSLPTKDEIKKIMSDVISSINKNLPNYKHIKEFDIRDKEFDKTTTQKIKRYGDNLKPKK